MNHPSAEEWMAYLYRELPKANQASLSSHLKACAQCQERVAEWKKAMAGLAQWNLPTPVARPSAAWIPPTMWKWAAAAVLVLAIGFGFGRFSAPPVSASTRASLAAEVKRQVQDQLLADWQAVLNDEPGALNTPFRRQLRSGLDDWTASKIGTANGDDHRLLAEFLETYQANRQKDQQVLLTLLSRSEQKYQRELVQLRRSIETVAVVAADKFQRTDSELGQLATYTQAKFTANEPGEPFNK